MISPGKEHEWSKYIKFFGETNVGRRTRLGVFERENGNVTDYWLESGLPLAGLDMDAKNDVIDVQIRIGDLTHVIDNAVKFTFHLSHAGDEDGADITDAAGRTTILRFETAP